MKEFVRMGVAMGWAVVALSGCTPKGESVSETSCTVAIARATQAWRVKYYRERTNLFPNNERVEEFGSVELVNRNGQKPLTPTAEADENGIWYSPAPPQPSSSEMAKSRQMGERIAPPELYRAVRYSLQCGVGELEANLELYREASQAIQANQEVRISYEAKRAVKTLAAADSATTANSGSPTPGSPNPAPTRSPAEATAVLYVDPEAGDNSNQGTQNEPLKTVTHALELARSGTVIRLRPAFYSADSGEVFPLTLKPGVILRGDPDIQGDGIQITGGGTFLSPTWAGQSVTILAVDRARIEGVSVTNPSTRGTAIWVETGAPLIERNTFVGSDREGLFVSGKADPTIRYNKFAQNGGNGMSFTRDCSGTVSHNTIRNNGTGIAISEKAAPKLSHNQITQNKDGLVINGAATPTLEANMVQENGRDGIVVTTKAKPTFSQNILSGNGEFDLHNATDNPLKVSPASLAGAKVEGRVN